MKRKTAIVLSLAALAALVAVGIFEPTRILRGLAFREAFYRSRPTSYWREIIRADGEAGRIQPETRDWFDDLDAVPVLRVCVHDADPSVRWASLCLFEWAAFGRDVESVAVDALDDPDVDVRFAAIRILGRRGRESLGVIPQLVELARSADESEIRDAANNALWAIDEPAAIRAGDWREFKSDQWRFTVMMPGTPEHTESFVDTPYGPATSHKFLASFGIAQCVVGVTEYSPEVAKNLTLKERYESSAELLAAALDGEMTRHEPIELFGVPGRELVVRVDRNGEEFKITSRAFVVGDRLYQVNLTAPVGEISANALNYFLDSFRIEYESTE